MLLDKISWIQTFQHDQGAYDETILEVVGIVEQAFAAKPRSTQESEEETESSEQKDRNNKAITEEVKKEQQDEDKEGAETSYVPDAMEDVDGWYRGNDLRSFTADFYDSICMPWLFPDANGAHQIAAYSMCWWQNLKEFGGTRNMIGIVLFDSFSFSSSNFIIPLVGSS